MLVSTVAIKESFSAGGSILDQTHSSMSPESVEAQSSLNDWTKAMLKRSCGKKMKTLWK